jgi:uncharacterized coiled-coil protein SlyX
MSEALEIAPQAAGFHAENQVGAQESTIDAIANLATATAEDRKAVSNLTETNATLTKALAKSSEKLIAAMTQVNTLTKQLADLKATNGTQGSSPSERKHYCWTCGYRCEHSSWNCPTPATGHQKRAKAADTMNGSVTNKPAGQP